MKTKYFHSKLLTENTILINKYIYLFILKLYSEINIFFKSELQGKQHKFIYKTFLNKIFFLALNFPT